MSFSCERDVALTTSQVAFDSRPIELPLCRRYLAECVRTWDTLPMFEATVCGRS